MITLILHVFWFCVNQSQFSYWWQSKHSTYALASFHQRAGENSALLKEPQQQTVLVHKCVDVWDTYADVHCRSVSGLSRPRCSSLSVT